MNNSLPQNSTIVLVHGAWADGSCWTNILLPLEFYRDGPHAEAPKLTPDEHGFIWMPEDSFARAVAHKASGDQNRILAAVQRPISVRCIQEAAKVPGWKAKPSWFLIAEEDRMINPKTQQFMARRMGSTVRSSRVDHSPMYTAPELVVDVILEAREEELVRKDDRT